MSQVAYQPPLFFPTQDTVSGYEYLVVLNPDSRISTDVRAFKNKVWEMIGDYPSRYSHPHITLYNFLGFKHKEDFIIDAVGTACAKVNVQPIQIDSFSCFIPSGTIYLVPQPKEYFSDLLKRLYPNLFNCKGINRHSSIYGSTEPHITIARALKREDFDLVWPYFKDMAYRSSFTANSLVLLRKELTRNAQFQQVATFPL
jgi:2'-5' RNA ligase